MVQKITTWKTSDGQVFDNPEEADRHEKVLSEPEYQLKTKISELEKRSEKLEAENLKRIAEIETVKHPYGIINQKPWWERLAPTFINGNNGVYYGEGNSLQEAFNNLKEVNK